MSRKLAGAAVEQVQAPIGHSPGDPDLLYTFRAPGLGKAIEEAKRRKMRRVARLEFDDGSDCGCGAGCEALQGGCCVGPFAPPCDAAEAPRVDLAGARCCCAPLALPPLMYVLRPTLSSFRRLALSPGDSLPPCPSAAPRATTTPGGAALVITWHNRASYPVRLSVLDHLGAETTLPQTLGRDSVIAFNTHAGVVWRARNLNGEMLTQTSAVKEDATTHKVTVHGCKFRYEGAEATWKYRSPASRA